MITDTSTVSESDLTSTVKFTVDSNLLHELGARLVGKPHVALAELVKNSYDADSFDTAILYAPESDYIQVEDCGEGMTFPTFRDKFMRIGSTHKATQKFSPIFSRPLTGSKGIGRLSVQFLASRLTIVTVPRGRNGEHPRGVIARINWEKAVDKGELTEVEAVYNFIAPGTETFTAGRPHGTRLTLEGLRHQWSSQDLTALAGELWSLQSPYQEAIDEGEPSRPQVDTTSDPGMPLRFLAGHEDLQEPFRRKLSAIKRIWYARLRGRYRAGEAIYELELPGSDKKVLHHRLVSEDAEAGGPEAGPSHAELAEADFEVLIYHLRHRQPEGIKVKEARDYLDRYGGVQVFDAGFRLPFYGHQTTDWLGIERDHSRRLQKSDLLPKHLQFGEGRPQNNVPTLNRILGQVWVNTSKEQRLAEERRQILRDGLENCEGEAAADEAAEDEAAADEAAADEHLSIQLTRDRLIENQAYFELKKFVRFGIHWYAHQETARLFEVKKSLAPRIPVEKQANDVVHLLNENKGRIPEAVHSTLMAAARRTEQAAKSQEDVHRTYIGLLGSLATAGMTTLAYRHELEKMILGLEALVTDLRAKGEHGFAERSSTIVEKVRQLDVLFAALTDQESREERARYRLRPVIEDICRHIRFLGPDIPISFVKLDSDTRLPPGTLAEWTSIFQNVVVNAFNAMLESDRRVIEIRHQRTGKWHSLLFSDTGVGIDLATADRLFAPFRRELQISSTRRRLGYGGSGLGLTIVRMIAHELQCKVDFIRPEPGWSTTFRLRWKDE